MRGEESCQLEGQPGTTLAAQEPLQRAAAHNNAALRAYTAICLLADSTLHIFRCLVDHEQVPLLLQACCSKQDCPVWVTLEVRCGGGGSSVATKVATVRLAGGAALSACGLLSTIASAPAAA